MNWLCIGRPRGESPTLAGKGVVGHRDDRLIEGTRTDMCSSVEHCFQNLLVCGQSTRSMLSDLKGALNQLRYVLHYIYMTPSQN